MGLTYIEGVVTASQGCRALCGSWSIAFALADGTLIDRDVSECHIALPQGDGHTPVILGEVGDEALLGVVTLEILGFVLNPFNRTLQPARLLLA